MLRSCSSPDLWKRFLRSSDFPIPWGFDWFDFFFIDRIFVFFFFFQFFLYLSLHFRTRFSSLFPFVCFGYFRFSVTFGSTWKKFKFPGASLSREAKTLVEWEVRTESTSLMRSFVFSPSSRFKRWNSFSLANKSSDIFFEILFFKFRTLLRW